MGRYYSMNRDHQWDRTEKAYKLLTEGVGAKTENVASSVMAQYQQGRTDENIEPIVLAKSQEELVSDGDSLVFINFREDSARQLSYAFSAQEKIKDFKTKSFQNLFFVTMTEYEKDLGAKVAFPPKTTRYSLSGLTSQAGLKQFKVAETEKYAHITYFLNGGEEAPFEGEDRKLLQSLEVPTFAQTPQMKAVEIGNALIAAIESGQYGLLVANFANADMLGHTGNFSAAIQGVEIVDSVLGHIVKAILEADGVMFITADHGNAEYMINPQTSQAVTKHSSNPIPYYIVASRFRGKQTGMLEEKEVSGILSDVTATILDLLGIPVPKDMDGTSLLLGLQ